MNTFQEYFKGKKVTVMGLGLLGRGIGDTAFLAESGAHVTVTDLKTREQLAESLVSLETFSSISYVLGEHRFEDFENKDFILVAAGVPMDSPYLAHAQEARVPLVQSAALFVQLSKIPTIGITGTRGKSTVTHMIHHVLTQSTEGGKILLGGNVRGVSNLQLLKEVAEDSLAVMELDSWQLQGFGWANISPQVSVFTTFMEDHMNYYKNDMDAYFLDKAQIFLHQEEDGVFITTQTIFDRAQALMRKFGKEFTQEIRLVDASLLPEDCILSTPGEHNRLNAALATEALRAVGLTDDEIFEGLASFPGIPGRLEYLGSINGIRVYNDNNATTPQATIEGIKAIADQNGKKNVILIAGGAYKEVDPSVLVPSIDTYCKATLLLNGSGTEYLRKAFEQNVSVNRTIAYFDVLASAFEEALRIGTPGDVILFSPAFASFGMFTNEYDRNDQFVALVREQL